MSKVKIKFKAGDICGRLTVVNGENIYVTYKNGRKTRAVLCECDCGKQTVVHSNKLASGHTQSCGCFMDESRGKSSITHGLCKEPLFDVWRAIKFRCDNPRCTTYEYYGGRGISYPEKWKDYHGFMEDMYPTFSEGLTLDRIDVNKDYSKENCRWVDMGVQGHNRRAYEGCTSAYTGVFKMDSGFNTYINLKKKRCYLHVWKLEKDAAKAYDDASELLYSDRPNGTTTADDHIKQKVMKKLESKGFIQKPLDTTQPIT